MKNTQNKVTGIQDNKGSGVTPEPKADHSNALMSYTEDELFSELAERGEFLIISIPDYGIDNISIDGQMYSIRDIIKQLPKKAFEELTKDLGVSRSTLKRYFNGEISQEIAVQCAAAWAKYTGKVVQSGKNEIISIIRKIH